MENPYAIQRIIKDVKNDDERIQITGYVKNITDDQYIVLNDKTGQIKVNISQIDFNFRENDLINVIGNLDTNMRGEKILKAEIAQDMNKLNFNYYTKLYELKKEIE